MNSFNVAELKENTYFTSDVVLDKTFLLLNSAIPVNQMLIKALQDWDFRQVFSDGTLSSGAAKTEMPPVQKEPLRSTSIQDTQFTQESSGDTEK